MALPRGTPWRDIPERYGPRTTLCNRFGEQAVVLHRWRAAGRCERIPAAVRAACDGDIVSIIADRAYVTDAIRNHAERRGVWADIPPRE